MSPMGKSNKPEEIHKSYYFFHCPKRLYLWFQSQVLSPSTIGTVQNLLFDVGGLRNGPRLAQILDQ